MPASKNAISTCQNCGREFHPTNGKSQKYCRHECYLEHKSGPIQTLTCSSCGKKYQARGKRIPKYCSSDCYDQARRAGLYDNRITVHCFACGKPMQKFPKKAQHATYHFCSHECGNALCVPVECQECSKTFMTAGRAYRTAKFCSNECRNARNRREQIHKRTPKVTLTCEYCGKSFGVRRSIGAIQRYCSQTCSARAIGERFKGESSPVWKEKITVTCDYCGKNFKTHQSRRGRRKYCCQKHRILGHLARLAQNPRTDIEIAMAAALKRNKIAFDEQVPMFDKFLVDFLLRDHKIVIQCDGTYWHDRPNVKHRDKGQDRYLAKAGYIVLRFSDKQIYDDLNGCIKRVKQAIATGQMPLINW